MPRSHVVREGDCIESIAEQYGWFWETLWKDAANTELKKTRKEPHHLVAGDVVQIPDLRLKQEKRAAEASHRFKRKGVPSKLRICAMRHGEPRKNEPYRVDIDGRLTKGTTDGEGHIELTIPSSARKATLHIGPETDEYVYKLQLGCLEPITEITGIKQRLDNLGYEVGELDDTEDDTFTLALKKFQGDQKIESTGKLDDVTRKKIEAVYGW